jgi:uncharacterized protein
MTPRLEDLPAVVPVFALPAPLLLPGTVVRLAAAEPWQRHLLEEAMAGDSYVAIVQPIDPESEEDPSAEKLSAGELFSVGCLGTIGEVEEEEPELRVLAGGVIRFRIVGEEPDESEYPRLRVDYSDFVDDLSQVEDLDFTRLKEMVRVRLENQGSPLDPTIMDGMAGTEIVTALAHACPFSPAERQVLMETRNLLELEDVLLDLMAGPAGMLRLDLPPLLPS